MCQQFDEEKVEDTEVQKGVIGQFKFLIWVRIRELGLGLGIKVKVRDRGGAQRGAWSQAWPPVTFTSRSNVLERRHVKVDLPRHLTIWPPTSWSTRHI